MGFFKKLAKSLSGTSGYAAGAALSVVSPSAGGALIGLTGIKHALTGDDSLALKTRRKFGVDSDALAAAQGDSGGGGGGGGGSFTAGVPYGGGGGGSGGGIPVALLTQLGGAVRQQTPAVRAMLQKAAGARGGRRSAAKRRPKKTARAKSARRSAKRGGKAKYNSAAWMKKIRGMRRKKK